MIASQCSHHLCQPAAHHCRSCGMPICRHCPGWRRLSPACYACLYKNHNSLFPLPRHLLGLRQLRVGVDALSALLVIGYTWTEIVLLASTVSGSVLTMWIEQTAGTASWGTDARLLILFAAIALQLSGVLWWLSKRGLGLALFCAAQLPTVFIGLTSPDLMAGNALGTINFPLHGIAALLCLPALGALLVRRAAQPDNSSVGSSKAPSRAGAPSTLPTLKLPRLLLVFPLVSFSLASIVIMYRMLFTLNFVVSTIGFSPAILPILFQDYKTALSYVLSPTLHISWPASIALLLILNLTIAAITMVPLLVYAFQNSHRQLRMPVTRSGPDRVAFSRLEGVLSPVLDQRWRVRLVQSLNPAGDISTSGGRRGAIIHLPKGAIHNIKNSGGVSDQTRAILGHELTHVQQDSTLFSSVLVLPLLAGMALNIVMGLLSTGVFLFVAAMFGGEAAYGGLLWNGLKMLVVDTMVFVAIVQFARHRELEADRGALTLFTAAGEHISQALEVGKRRWRDLLSHPPKKMRARALESLEGELPLSLLAFTLHGWAVNWLAILPLLWMGGANFFDDSAVPFDPSPSQALHVIWASSLSLGWIWFTSFAMTAILISLAPPQPELTWRQRAGQFALRALFFSAGAVMMVNPPLLQVYFLTQMLGFWMGSVLGRRLAEGQATSVSTVLSPAVLAAHIALLFPVVLWVALYALALANTPTLKSAGYVLVGGMLSALTVRMLWRIKAASIAGSTALLALSGAFWGVLFTDTFVFAPSGEALAAAFSGLYRPLDQQDVDVLEEENIAAGLQAQQQTFFYDTEASSALGRANLALYVSSSEIGTDFNRAHCLATMRDLESFWADERGLTVRAGLTDALQSACMEKAEHSFIGVTAIWRYYDDHQLFEQKRGVLIKTVLRGSQAERLGLEPLELIVRYNGHDIYTIEQLQALVGACTDSVSCPSPTVEVIEYLSLQPRELAVEPGRLGVALEEIWRREDDAAE